MVETCLYVNVGRKRVRVLVFDTLIELRREGKLRGDPDTRRMYAFFDRTRGRVPTVAFARKYTGSNTVAHEATHIGFWLAPTRNGLTSEEPLAEAVGTVMGKLVAALYKHGIYELSGNATGRTALSSQAGGSPEPPKVTRRTATSTVWTRTWRAETA